MFYTDIQGKVGGDNGWLGGIGLGYRGLYNQRLLGGYLFLDRDTSAWHDTFYVLNPGIETIGCDWDFRINGYFPVSERHKRTNSFFFHEVQDSCGFNVNNDSVFIGHQQLSHRFHQFQEVGSGADAEIGVHFPRVNDLALYGGGYYYHLDETADIKGAEARVVFPVKSAVALTLEASYDNQQRGAVVGGLRVQLGHLPCKPIQLSTLLYEPIIRNIGTVKTGSGIPVVHGRKEEDFFVERDNIYFFSSKGGTAFAGNETGTFENPLSANQFTQTTVDGIASLVDNANFFFNSGSYIIAPNASNTPNARLSLPEGQSLYGRTADYKYSAIGNARPTLQGGLNLYGGNNHLDSIILNNTTTNPRTDTNLIGLDIEMLPTWFFVIQK